MTKNVNPAFYTHPTFSLLLLIFTTSNATGGVPKQVKDTAKQELPPANRCHSGTVATTLGRVRRVEPSPRAWSPALGQRILKDNIPATGTQPK